MDGWMDGWMDGFRNVFRKESKLVLRVVCNLERRNGCPQYTGKS